MLLSVEPMTVVIAKPWLRCSFLVNIVDIVAKERHTLICQVNFFSLCDVALSIAIPENLSIETKIE
jgi:hypothetical protein